LLKREPHIQFRHIASRSTPKVEPIDPSTWHDLLSLLTSCGASIAHEDTSILVGTIFNGLWHFWDGKEVLHWPGRAPRTDLR
jgi:hypothetical protein